MPCVCISFGGVDGCRRSRWARLGIQSGRRGARGWCIALFFFQAEDGIRDTSVTGVQTCALPISFEADGAEAAAFPLGALPDCFFCVSGCCPSTEKVWATESEAQRRKAPANIMRTRVRFTGTLTMGVAEARCRSDSRLWQICPECACLSSIRGTASLLYDGN